MLYPRALSSNFFIVEFKRTTAMVYISYRARIGAGIGIDLIIADTYVYSSCTRPLHTVFGVAIEKKVTRASLRFFDEEYQAQLNIRNNKWP